jgi:hypothetical protein
MVPFGQFVCAISGQGNLSGTVQPTAQLELFPVNINVYLNDDGLQLNFMAGTVWSLAFCGRRVYEQVGNATGGRIGG